MFRARPHQVLMLLSLAAASAQAAGPDTALIDAARTGDAQNGPGAPQEGQTPERRERGRHDARSTGPRTARTPRSSIFSSAPAPASRPPTATARRRSRSPPPTETQPSSSGCSKRGRRPERQHAGRRDRADGRLADRHRGSGRGADRARCRRERPRIDARADGADVGGGRRARRRDQAAAQGRCGPQREVQGAGRRADDQRQQHLSSKRRADRRVHAVHVRRPGEPHRGRPRAPRGGRGCERNVARRHERPRRRGAQRPL